MLPCALANEKLDVIISDIRFIRKKQVKLNLVVAVKRDLPCSRLAKFLLSIPLDSKFIAKFSRIKTKLLQCIVLIVCTVKWTHYQHRKDEQLMGVRKHLSIYCSSCSII
jgi:hypothetical protein